MKIIKFKKLKNSQYEITMENKVLVIYEDLILKHGLLLTHDINESLMSTLEKENLTYQGYSIALKYIKTKLRSPSEIKTLLLKKSFEMEQIDKILDLLITQGYLNDKLYTSAFIHDKITLSMDGPNKIIRYLENQGVGKDIITDCISSFTKEQQIDKLNRLIAKEIKTNRNKSSKILLQKIIIKLINLGYDKELILSLLSNYKIDDTVMKKKEYDKIYSKLSKKYTGSELEYKIKQKMYQKGFSNYEA